MFSKNHNPMEAKSIRESLRIRETKSKYNDENKYEVYSTIHGSGIFKWFIVSKETFEWYKKQFSLTPEVHVS